MMQHPARARRSIARIGWRVILKDLNRLGPFRWNAMAPWRAARVALGVVLPLVLGWAFGDTEMGAFAALGALPAGFLSLQGEARRNVAAVVLASLGMALSTAVGAATAACSPWALVPMVAIWGYITGLAASLGLQVSTAILQWSMALLIAVGVPASPKAAALRAAVVLASGLFQAVLVVVAWAFRPGSAERTALAQSYQALAAYASAIAAGKAAPPPPVEFPAGAALGDPNPLLASAMRLALLDLLEEAERVRASLAALAAFSAEQQSAEADDIRVLLLDAAIALALIAKAILAPNKQRAALVHQLRARLHDRSAREDAAWRWAGEALLGQLRTVGRSLANLHAVPLPRPGYDAATARSLARRPGNLGSIFATLRDNVGLTSEAGRHALRLAVAAALAETMVEATGLDEGRWVTLTVFIILKPDYRSTLSRGVQRAVGTLVGAGLGIVAAIATQTGQAGMIAASGISVAVAYALFDVNYLLYSIFLTSFVVVLLGLLGFRIVETAEARMLDTVIGAAWGIAAYAAWPTWQGTSAQDQFSRLLEAHRAYLASLLLAACGASSEAMDKLRVLQGSARRVRSDAEAAATRLSGEPGHPPLTPELAQTLIATVARLAQAELALHAFVLSQHQSTGPKDAAIAPPGFKALAAAFDVAMRELVMAIENMQAPPPIPALRPLELVLRDDPVWHDSALTGIIDRLVDAINSLDVILRNRLPAGAMRPQH